MIDTPEYEDVALAHLHALKQVDPRSVIALVVRQDGQMLETTLCDLSGTDGLQTGMAIRTLLSLLLAIPLGEEAEQVMEIIDARVAHRHTPRSGYTH